MITVNIGGPVANYIDGTGMVTEPRNADERAFADHWNRRTIRRYGRGSRVTLTAPGWVFNWIADEIENLIYSPGMDVSNAEVKSGRQFLALLTRGVSGVYRNPEDGPTRDELIRTGYLS